MLEYLRELVARNGPLPDEFERLTGALADLAAAGVPATEVRAVLAPTMTTDCLQGLAFLKPHGYPGDYELIDRIYTDRRSPDPRLARWDDYFQSQAAPRAVRNRKRYFQELLAGLEAGEIAEPVALVVGCGPGRDVAEYFDSRPESRVTVHAVDLDPNAVEHAMRLCGACDERVRFESRNPKRLRPERSYDLIWCPGLFDYFDDEAFAAMLAKLLSFRNPGGEVAVGNFAEGNPTRLYMEMVGDWFLRYRTEEQLRELARRAGAGDDCVRVCREGEGVNLFLHVRAA